MKPFCLILIGLLLSFQFKNDVWDQLLIQEFKEKFYPEAGLNILSPILPNSAIQLNDTRIELEGFYNEEYQLFSSGIISTFGCIQPPEGSYIFVSNPGKLKKINRIDSLIRIKGILHVHEDFEEDDFYKMYTIKLIED